MNKPFCPSYKSTQSVTTASSSVAIAINGEDSQVRIVNTGANGAYIRIAESGATATTSDHYIPANWVEVITKDMSHSSLAYIWDGAATTLKISTGRGD